jgi:hypothetical protein
MSKRLEAFVKLDPLVAGVLPEGGAPERGGPAGGGVHANERGVRVDRVEEGVGPALALCFVVEEREAGC